MTQTTYPASQAQMSFIASLMGKRVVPDETVKAIKGAALTSRQASAYIDLLKSLPMKPITPEGESPWARYIAAFEGVENSKYAIRGVFLTAIPGLEDFKNDFLFLEVKTWQGKRYLNQLHGAPGDFSRTRFPLAVGTALLQFIKGRHVEFAQAFGEHFVCCGRCAAPLTDEESRRVHLGPECRKVWAL